MNKPIDTEFEADIVFPTRICFTIDQDWIGEITHIQFPQMSKLNHEQMEHAVAQMNDEIERIKAERKDNAP